jgi:hypothetical protein
MIKRALEAEEAGHAMKNLHLQEESIIALHQSSAEKFRDEVRVLKMKVLDLE